VKDPNPLRPPRNKELVLTAQKQDGSIKKENNNRLIPYLLQLTKLLVPGTAILLIVKSKKNMLKTGIKRVEPLMRAIVRLLKRS
jgi:hypothetical protein